jgi:hypothetical protein
MSETVFYDTFGSTYSICIERLRIEVWGWILLNRNKYQSKYGIY